MPRVHDHEPRPRPRLARLALPWTRREWKGTWRLLRRLGVNSPDADAAWATLGERVVRGRFHRYRMIVRPGDWADRAAYFLARYYDLPTQRLLTRLLRPGDRFADVGANHGMLTLLGARLVGAAGVVDAFEPNPAAADRLRRQLELNGIRHVRLHAAALSDHAGDAELHVSPDHTGYGTLNPVEPAARRVLTQDVSVPLRRGDDALAADPRPVAVLKIDVEGHEVAALKGLGRTLARDRPAVLSEVNPCCLRRAGHDAAAVIDLLHAHGYAGYRVDTSEPAARATPDGFRLERLTEPPRGTQTFDSLWLHPAHAPAATVDAAMRLAA